MLKLSGQKLVGEAPGEIGDALPILYVPGDYDYFLVCGGVAYPLEKSGNHLVWALPAGMGGGGFSIKVQVADSATHETVFFTNEVEVAARGPSAFSGFRTDYPYYDMADGHPAIAIENRKVKMPTNYQIVVARDNVSQLLTFEMPRLFDGVDLLGKACGIKYRSPAGGEGKAVAVNVHASQDTLRFGWLLDENVADKDGTVKFAIEFLGKNEFGQFYVWQTVPAEFKVEAGLFVDDAVVEERYPTVIEDIQVQLRIFELMVREGGGVGYHPDWLSTGLNSADKLEVHGYEAAAVGHVPKKGPSGVEWGAESGVVSDVTLGGASVLSGGVAALPPYPAALPANGGDADTVGGKPAADFATAAQGAKADTAVQVAGGAMGGPLVAQGNMDYGVAQVRNVVVTDADLAGGSVPLLDGAVYFCV